MLPVMITINTITNNIFITHNYNVLQYWRLL